MNRAILIGRLTKEPEFKSTPSGVSVCTFTLAVDRRFKQEGQQQADFISIVTWRGQADNCAKYLHKGSQVGVCGSIQTRTYDDKNGNKVYVTEINAEEVQFLSKGNNEAESGSISSQNGFVSQMTPVEADDVPF
jgi:single-strand DNA-binding protein